MNYVAFPNLNIDLFLLNPVAFTLFGRDVMWYGVIITCAIVLGVIYVMLRAKQEKLLVDDVYDYALIVVPTAIVFARLFYVVFDPTPNYKNFIDVIAIWRGGLAIYGAVIGGALAAFLVSKWKKVYFSRMADLLCPAVMLGQAIGRWGNFMNGEAYGSVTKFDFLFLSFDISELTLTSPFLMVVNGVRALPTFFFESVWNIIGFVLICTVVNKYRQFAGANTLFYFAWYGFGRMFIEGLRTDSLGNGSSFRISQLIGLLSFVLATTAFIYLSIRAKKHPFDKGSSLYYGSRLEKLKAVGFICDKSDVTIQNEDISDEKEDVDTKKTDITTKDNEV